METSQTTIRRTSKSLSLSPSTSICTTAKRIGGHAITTLACRAVARIVLMLAPVGADDVTAEITSARMSAEGRNMARFDLSQYVDVQERIVRFWTENPNGAIRTRLMSPPDDFSQCRYEASIFKNRDSDRPDATGYAFELAGGSGPNSTSHEENCETSAIGRAFANLGYATTRENRPSRQEMTKANRDSDYEAGEINGQATGNLPPRTRTTTQNVVPASAVSGPGDWTGFWNVARPMGFNDKASVEKAINGSLPQSAELAMEKLNIWAKDNASQRSLVS